MMLSVSPRLLSVRLDSAVFVCSLALSRRLLNLSGRPLVSFGWLVSDFVCAALGFDWAGAI